MQIDLTTFLLIMVIIGLMSLVFGIVIGVGLARPRYPRETRW